MKINEEGFMKRVKKGLCLDFFCCVVDLGKDNCVTVWGVVEVKEESMGFG